MYLQYLFTPYQIRIINCHLAVETSGAQQRGIELELVRNGSWGASTTPRRPPCRNDMPARSRTARAPSSCSSSSILPSSRWDATREMTIFWVDPAEDLAVILMTQFMPSGTFNFRGQMKSLVYPAIEPE